MDGETASRDGNLVPPRELRSPRLRKSVRGYDATQVDELLATIRASYERLWRDRYELELEVGQLKEDLERYEQEAHVMRDVLVSVRKDALKIRTDARAAAEEILGTAQARAEKTISEAEAKVATLSAEVERLQGLQRELHAGYRAFLLAALEVLDSATSEQRATNGTAEEMPVDALAAELRKSIAPSG
jgi:DivIVA domain-containing protein